MDATPSAPLPPLSLAARMWGVVVFPRRVFDLCASQPVAWVHWVATSVLISVFSVAVSWKLFSDPVLVAAMRAQSDRVMEERVASGRSKPEDAERARQMLNDEGSLTTMRLAVGIFGSIGLWLVPFWWGAFLWVIGSWVFRSETMTFARGVEVASLAGVISALGLAVKFGLMTWTGELKAGLHLGMLVREFNPGLRSHQALSAVEAFALWHLLIMSLGLSRVIHRPWRPVAVVLGGVWLGFKVFSILAGLGQRAV